MKKILSFLLALSMVLSCVPMPVLAEETQPDIVVTEPTVPETTVATEPTVPETNEATEPAAVCTCESDDPDWHAPFCALFEMPENPACYCAEKCTADTVNEWCEVCYFDLSACGGSEEENASSYNVETDKPVIHSVSVDKTQVSAGDSVTVTMEVTDESELDQVYVTFDTPNEGVANMIQVTLSEGEDGLYCGTLTTDDSFASGTYYAYYIVAEDVHGNRNQINQDESVCFELISDRTENNAPVINLVSLDKTQVRVGESVTVTMDVADESELAQVRVTFEMPFAGVAKMIDVNLTRGADGLYRGTLTTDDTYPCGTYYAYYIVAEDIYGNREQINQDRSVSFDVVIGGVETNAPVINSVTLDKTQVVAGETVAITVDVADESELTDVYVYFNTPIAAGSSLEIRVNLTLDEDGLYRGTLTTDKSFANGNYYVSGCIAKDVYSNYTQIQDKSACFELSGGYEDTTAPVITDIIIDKSEVIAGEAVTITVDVTDESDLSDAYVYFNTPVAAGSSLEIRVNLTLGEDGLYRGTLTTDKSFANGNYYVSGCIAKDVYGNYTQIQDKSACFELSGGHTEINAPVINSVTLDKSKVAAGETVSITVDVTDESELTDVYVYFNTPIAAGSSLEIRVNLTLDEDGLYRGTLTTDESFANGNYYVSGCIAKDVYGNYTQIQDKSACFEFGVTKIETDAPVINSITLDKTQVVTGESVTVTMDVTDASELDQVYVKFDTPHAGVAKMIHVELIKGDDGLYRGTLTTDDTYPYGTYYAYYIVAQDVLGNREQINRDTSLAFELIPYKPIYTVTWNINGEKYNETEVKSGETITAPDYTVPEGYTFSGWDIPETMPAEDIELDATLTVNQYKVKYQFMVYGGAMDVEQTLDYGAELEYKGEIPENPGYVPGEWLYFYRESGEQYLGTTVPAGDLRAQLIWTDDTKYTVNFYDGEELVETLEVGSFDYVAVPERNKEGHTFLGWFDEDGNGIQTPYGKTADSTYYAKWEVNSYNVTWVVDGTETEETYKYGETIQTPENPVKEGNRCVTYTFEKWDGFSDGMTMPAEDQTFTAVFAAKERHIDRNRDHICDRKCGKTDIGEHADSATDKDHRCDYGCKAILEACSDKDGDRNHNCDICRKKNVTAHTYAEATCTKPAICTECGAKHGKLKAHTWNDGKVLKKPTCTKPGVMGFKCKDCHKSHIEVIKPEGHDWDNGKVTKKATCTKDGVKTYTCESCRATRTVKIKAVGHDYHNGVCRNCRDKKFHNHGFHGWWHPWWK